MTTQNPKVRYEVNGLRCAKETRPGDGQSCAHSHNEIEVLLVERGEGLWLMPGNLLSLKAGQLAAFWAVRPHQLIKTKGSMVVHWITVPFSAVVGWRLPEIFINLLMAGHVIVEPEKELFPIDRHAMEKWREDMLSPDSQRQRLALMEIEARMRRLSLTVQGKSVALGKSAPAKKFFQSQFDKISQIADFVTRNFQDPITVKEIALRANMSPGAATKLFGGICGMNLMQYITLHRMFQAQRLLLSTELKVVDVAMESGYQSSSRFYAAFKQFCGLSPREYRKSLDLDRAFTKRKSGVLQINSGGIVAPTAQAA
jgi:AraC-like DNA-binding protein